MHNIIAKWILFPKTEQKNKNNENRQKKANTDHWKNVIIYFIHPFFWNKPHKWPTMNTNVNNIMPKIKINKNRTNLFKYIPEVVVELYLRLFHRLLLLSVSKLKSILPLNKWDISVKHVTHCILSFRFRILRPAIEKKRNTHKIQTNT